jgi:hypothetical protein
MKGALHYPGGVEVVFSPTNQAWLVLWQRTVLRVFSKRAEAVAYADEITTHAEEVTS